MQRPTPFLVLFFSEVLRFIVLTLMITMIGLFGSSSLFASSVRYLIVPQLIFVVGYFLMWYDYERYKNNTALFLVLKIIALIPIAFMLRDFYYAGERFQMARLSVLLVIALEITSIITLIFSLVHNSKQLED